MNMPFQDIDLRLHRRNRGFTLIELMIVVAIIAIIAAVALPSYFDSIRKSRRADAISEIARVQQAQERWRANNVANNATLTGAGGLGLQSATTSGSYYTLSLAVPATDAAAIAVAGATTGDSYSVIASVPGPTSSQWADANCRVLKANIVKGEMTYLAGATASGLNDASTNITARRCWNR